MNANQLPALPIAIAGALALGLRKAGGLLWRCYERRQQRLDMRQRPPQSP